MRDKIEQAIKEALSALGAEGVSFVVERPVDFAHGDYATNAALVAAKTLKTNPAELALQLVSQLGTIEGVQKITPIGGFINFRFAYTVLLDVVHDATKKQWGKNLLYKSKKIMVEYTDPNPFKEFHIGHLMSNAIGESVARLLEFSGAEVVRANYQGDVGLHVAKTLWGEGLDMSEVGKILNTAHTSEPTAALLGRWYASGALAYETNESSKIEIDKINGFIYKILAGQKIDDKREALISNLYAVGKRVSLAHFDDIYKKLGTSFDKFFFESETWQKGLELVKNHIGGIFEESEGAVVYRGEQDGLHTRVFINKAGLPTYEAKDLGLLLLKKAAGEFDLSITVTANEQKEYFKVVLAAAKHLDEVRGIAEKTQHITHGMMRFADGKMSSRKGNVVTGESLLSDLTEAARGQEDVAVGAVKYAVLRSGSGKDIVFDPEKSLSLEGSSGPYLQYALVRARALLNKIDTVGEVLEMPVAVDKDWDEFALDYRLRSVLFHFPDVMTRAAVELEPHYIATYITELSAIFNSWYATDRIIVDGKVLKGKFELVKAFENTLMSGLWCLGIPTPEKM